MPSGKQHLTKHFKNMNSAKDCRIAGGVRHKWSMGIAASQSLPLWHVLDYDRLSIERSDFAGVAQFFHCVM